MALKVTSKKITIDSLLNKNKYDGIRNLANPTDLIPQEEYLKEEKKQNKYDGIRNLANPTDLIPQQEYLKEEKKQKTSGLTKLQWDKNTLKKIAGGPVEKQKGSFVDSLIGGRNLGTQQADNRRLLSGISAEAKGKATIGSGLQETNFAAGLLGNTSNLNAGRQLPAIETSTTGRGSAGIGSTLPQNNYAASTVKRNNGTQAKVEDLEGNDLVNFLANTGNLTQTQNAGTIGGKSFLEMNRENNEAGNNPRYNAAMNNPAFVNARQKREGYDFPEAEPKKLNAWEIYSSAPDDMKSTIAGSLINRDNAQKLIEETWNSDLEGLADEHDKWNSVLQSATDANAKTAQTQDTMWDNFTSQRIRIMKVIPKNLTERPEDYNDHSEEYDRELYDTYYGKGAHDRIMTIGTREDKLRMMDELKELWRDVDNGNMARAYEINNQLIKNSSVYDQNEAYKRYAQEQLDNVRRKEAEQADYMDLMLKYGDNITNPKYVAAYDRGGQNPYSMNDIERGVQTSDVHRIYSFIGGGKEYDEWAKYSETDGQARISNEYSYAMLMDPKEKDIFMDKYNEAMAEGREPEEAKAFLQGLQNSLRSRYEPFEKVMIAEGARKVPISSSIASIMMDQANTWLDIPRHIANALGDKSTESGSSWWYKPAKTSETIKESVSDLITDKIGPVGGKTYLSLMNSLSNVVRGLETPGSTKLAKTILGLGGFFLQVDQQQTAKYIDKYGYKKARNMAAVDAAFEVAEEFLPYETMLGSVGKNFGLAFLQNATSEAAQELTGTVVFDRIKGILTGRDEEQARADEIFYKGEYVNSKGQPVYLSSDKGIALQQARVQAAKEKFDEAKESAIGGFMGGGFGAVYGQAAQAIGTEQVKRAAGQQIMNRGVTEGMTAQEKTAKNSENVYALIQAAKQMKEGTESRALAEQIEKDIANGKGYDKRKIGSLTRSVVGESGEKIGNIAKGIIRQSIKEDVQAAGLDDAEGWTDLITRAVTGEETSMMERARLAANKKASTIGMIYGSDAAMQIVKPEVHRQIMEQTKDERSVQETVLDMLRPEEDRQKEAGRYAGMMEGAETATKAEINAAGGLKTHSELEVIRDGQILEIVKANMRTVKEDGKDVQRLELDLSDGSKAVDAATVKAANEGLAKVLRFSAAGGNRLLGANTLNTVIMRAGKTADPATLARDAVRITLDTVMGTKSRTDLDEATDTELRDAAKQDYQAAEAERVRNYRQLKPGQGKVSFAGAEYGTKEFGKALQQLNRTQRNEADAIGKIAKAAGFTVNLIYDPENVKEQGSYSTADGITVNLAGEAYGGKHRSALATLAHEMTHWLEGNSQADYAKLRSFVMNNMQRSRYDVEGELQGIMANYARNGVELDLNGAMAEMIAKSAEELLTNEKVIRQLKESDPGLHGNIQRIVSDMVGRIQVALGQIKLSSSRYAQGMREYADKMSDLWLATYEEAKGVRGTGKAGTVQASQQESEIEHREQTIDIHDAIRNPEKYNDYFTYDHLTKKEPIKLVQLDQIDINKSRAEIVNDAMINAKENGREKGNVAYVKVYDTGTEVRVGNRGIRHSLVNTRLIQPIAEHLGEVLKESVLINTANPKRNGETGTYILLGAGRNSDGKGITYALFHVNMYTHDLEDIDYLYAINTEGAEVDNNKKTAAPSARGRHGLPGIPLTVSNVSIAKALESVKEYYASSMSKDVLSHFNINRNDLSDKNIQYLQHSIQDDMDAAYEDAVRRGDWRAAEDMLLEKAQRTEGITGYKAPHFYNGEHQDIAKEIKRNYGNAVARAVEDMAQMIPQNAVLIPMPPHTGVVTDDTDTMILAKALGEATGMPVVDALESDYHTSRYKAKAAGDRSVNANTMGFRQVAQIPEGAMPVFVDNMVGGGQTAMAAKNAIGRGITLAYAQSGRSKSQGVKALTVTYDKDGKLIPLSQRIDPNNSSWKYSVQEDAEYMDAVSSNDQDREMYYINQAAEAAGYDIENIAYHGTPDFGFTKFNMDRSQDTVFVSYNKKLAATYTKADKVKSISERKTYPNYYNLNDIDFAKFYEENYKDASGTTDILEVKKNESLSESMGHPVFDITLVNNNTGEYVEDVDDRRRMEKALKKQFNPNNENEGIYEFYTRPGRQLVVDAEGNNWDEIEFDLYGWEERGNDLTGYQWYPTDWSWDPDFDIADYEDEDADTLFGVKPRQIAKWAKAHGYDSVRINNVYDNGPESNDYDDGYGDIGIFFNPEDVKSADPVTYDDDGNVIPPSERFNTKEKDIRYSIEDDGTEIQDRDGNAVAEILPGGVVTAYSLATVDETVNEDLINDLIARGYGEKRVKKWVKDVRSIAAMIAADRARLDFKAVGKGMLKNNQEYIKTLDASTLCVKRQLYQGIYNEIQHLLPNTPLMPEDLIKLTNMMKERGMTSPCSLCYVESRRRLLGKYASEWLKTYDGEYIPRMEELTTTDGLQKLKEEHEDTYNDFTAAMNAKGSANPKVVEMRGEYKGEIMDMSERQIKKVKDIGGLRVQSFSDFETVHMLDMMQAVLDMAARELTSQAYTKVPDFAWIFGDTGIKINLSLIGDGTGLDENGNLVFSSTEGMDINEALKLREMYSKNVGTILVGMNDDHIIAAMGDDRIDFIIPFHKSGWGKKEMALMIGMGTYKDFTKWQNEKKIDFVREDGSIKTIPNKKSKISNFNPVNADGKWDGQSGYWDFSKNGEWNARKYLELCAADGRVPKFANFLVNNGDGSFSLPEDDSVRSQNIRKGYWKLLIDFKMYDNNGKGSPQTTVKGNFNMEAARAVLDKYEGGADTLPTNHALAQEFAKEYREEHPGRKQFSMQDDDDQNIRHWMMSVKRESLQTEAEKVLLDNFKNLDMRIDLKNRDIQNLRERIRLLNDRGEENLDADEKKQLQNLRIRLENAIKVRDQAEQELGKIVSSEGYGRMMKNQQRIYEDFMQGKTQQEVTETIGQLQQHVARITEEIEENRKRAEEIEGNGIIEKMKQVLGTTTVDKTAAELKKEFHSTWTKTEIRNYLDPIILKMASGEDITDDVQTLAGILIDSDSRNTYEGLSALRGLTITLGKGQQKELKAQHSSLKEIRERLAGTGITIKYGDHSTLEQDIEDLRAEFPNMPDFGNEKDALENFVSWVEGMKRQGGGQEFYAERLAETMATIMGKAAATAKGFYVPTESKAQKQIFALIEFIKGLNAETENAVQAMQRVENALGEATRAGNKAAGLSNVLLQHIDEALEYYDRTAKIAVATARRDRNNQIVEQLKSEHAQKIAKNNEEWRNLIERDRQARLQTEDNRKYRNRINTAMKRTYDLLKNPQGLKNIPEYMQGLARELLETIVDNDLSETRRTKLTQADRKQLDEAKRLLTEWKKQNGEFNIADVYEAEEAVALTMDMDLQAIRDGIEQLNRDIRGKNRLDSLQQRGEILRNIQEAVGEIYTAIRRENEIQVNKRRVTAEDQAYRVATSMHGKRATEYTGKAGRVIKMLHKGIVSGNMTPEYFFRTLGNAGLSELWENYHAAENRNGLELRKAQEKLAEIADKHGYSKWDMQQKITVPLASGDVEMTLGQIMSLWATWKRENTLGPQMSEHLTKGGFYAEKDMNSGILGKTVMDKRAHRITATDKETGINPDMDKVRAMLTEEQLQFIDDVVEYMSTDMSELGNEASMAAYGIKMYKEKYYFPFQMWNGIKSMKSNDAGNSANIDRAFHPSFSKSRLHGANNAIILGDFMQTAEDHIAGMINYATMGLANESLQKVLNIQLDEGEGTTKRNIRTMLEEAYGSEAMEYLEKLKTQLNGGAVRIDKTFYDRLISLFRKNAVAGSLSVAAQQPLSYIRAAVMVNPKYLAMAMNPATYKGSYKEMMEHSGVAVIKEMGRFDMNAGQSAREYLAPDAKETKWQHAWNEITDKATILPELMDRMTWTRIWTAVKLEQEAQHPDMDHKSDEFLDMVGERFNDVIRRTQVYDSVLVKSQNMRSEKTTVKTITSFMAEPTLTVNVLADAVRSAVNKEQGSKALLASAGVTFLLSAVVQAAVKGASSAGRNPDEKKNGVENFLYRFWSSFISEVDPLTLIPGYSTAIDLMKGREISDNALGAVKKIFDAGKTGIDALLGNNSRGAWRDIEDSVAQIAQLFTNLPAKNLMRDARAMYNWVTGAFEQTSPYAWRPTDSSVLKYQGLDLFMTADNLWGVVNQYLGEAGYQTDKNAYYQRIYDAKKAGEQEKAQGLIDYLLHGKGVKEESLKSGITKLAKADTSISAAEAANFLINEGANAEDYIKGELKEKRMSAEEARTALQKANPDKDADSIWWTVDRIQYQLETGAEKAPSGEYYRLKDAINTGDREGIKNAVKDLTAHGFTKDRIKGKLSDWKQEYLKATGSEKTKLKNALVNAYENIGISYTDANKIITGWEPKNTSKSGTKSKSKEKTTEEKYLAGTITRAQAENEIRKAKPGISNDDLWFEIDRLDFQKATGKDPGGATYYRMYHAIETGDTRSMAQIYKDMKAHGAGKTFKKTILDKYGKQYMDMPNSQEKIRLKNSLEAALKAAGVKDPSKEINNWVKKHK